MDVDKSVTARGISPQAPLVLCVHDVGFRGFAIETAAPVATRTRVWFEFSSLTGPLFTAEAVAVHCHRSFGDNSRWISGWEFPEQPGLDAAIDRLIDGATSAITID